MSWTMSIVTIRNSISGNTTKMLAWALALSSMTPPSTTL